MRCAWAKLKELSPILMARGASYRIKGKIYCACVQSDIWDRNLGDEESKSAKSGDDRTDDGEMDVGVSLKDRKCSVDLYSHLGIQRW